MFKLLRDKLKDTRYRLILGLSLIFILLLMVVILFGGRGTEKIPIVIEVQPATGSIDIPLDQTVRIKLDQPLKPDTLAFSLSPEVNILQSFEENGTILVIKPRESFSFSTNYVLTLSNVRLGKIILKTNFTTIRPSGSAESLVSEKNQKQNYPLAPFSPPDNAHFYFEYTSPLAITVITRGNSVTAKKEFEDWVKSLKIDISSHKIEWLEK